MSQEELLAKLFEQLLDSDDKKGNTSDDKTSEEENDLLGGIDLDAVMKLGEIMSQMNRSDKNTQLLLALKPHLRPENQQKADNAIKLIKIMNVLPLLKDSGVLDGLF